MQSDSITVVTGGVVYIIRVRTILDDRWKFDGILAVDESDGSMIHLNLQQASEFRKPVDTRWLAIAQGILFLGHLRMQTEMIREMTGQ